MFRVRAIEDGDREAIAPLATERWGSSRVVSRGKVHDLLQSPGFVAEMDGEIIGFTTCNIDGAGCEITSLVSLLENRGIGSRLVDAVIDVARRAACRRVWLITTNDNTRAIRWYQKRGFTLAAVHIGAIKRSREIKPEIPEFGMDGIPILHEFEFEKVL